ncbi:MAG: LacI family DNA-binding transcriptional regulator [Victivallales bacterium]
MNLKEMAAELGVSPSTVSRVLNGYKNFSVSASVRERIVRRADELGYTPNPMYQSMRQKSNRQISILFTSLMHTAQSCDSMAGVDELCEYVLSKGYSFHYLCYKLEHLREQGLMPPWKVAGAAVVDVRHAGLLTELDASGIPYVSLNGEAGPSGAAFLVDEAFHMKQAFDHLYALGHRKIGYLNIYREPELVPFRLEDHHYSVRERCAAYRELCNAYALETMPEAFSWDLLPEKAMELELARGCTAFIAYHFSSAVHAMHYCRTHGLRIPEDISLIAFNNSSMAELLDPALASIRLPLKDMGLAAGEWLLEKCKSPGTGDGAVFRFRGELIAGGSTAKCQTIITQ